MLKRVSYVFKLCDSCFGSVIGAADVQIYIDGIKAPFVYKAGGYFVLSDMAEGNYTAELRSWKYQSECIEFTVDYRTNFSSETNVRYCFLNPSRSHPQLASMPFVSGVLDSGEHELYLIRSKGELKIAEDGADAGKTEMRLFCGAAKPLIPSAYLISDKSADKNEFVVLRGVSGDMYSLGQPLKGAHIRSTPLLPLIRINTDENGGFFFIFPKDFKANPQTGEITFSLLYTKKKKLISSEYIANAKGETLLGKL